MQRQILHRLKLGMVFLIFFVTNSIEAQTCSSAWTEVGSANTGTESYTYDTNGRITNISSTVSFNYNTLGRLATITVPTFTISITAWDANGYPSAGTISGGQTGSYIFSFSNIGQLLTANISITGGQTITQTYTYDSSNNFIRDVQTDTGGSPRTRNYDGNCRGIVIGAAPGAVVSTAPIPTMSQWGLIIFGLLIMNLSVFYVQRRELI